MASKPIRGIHVFWGIFSFFAVVIAVDAFFITRAVGTFPGEQAKNSYVLGLEYNREVESRQRQEMLGWTAQAGFKNAGDLSLVLRIVDRTSAPVTGLYVTGEYFAPGSSGDERLIALREVVPGQYEAPIMLSRVRRIDVVFSARRSAVGAPVFEASKSLVIS